MEINNNYSNLPLADLSNLSSTVNLDALKNVDSSDRSNSFNVDAQSVVPRSDLSNSLKSILNDMEQAQVAVQQTNNSSTILNDIKTLIHATNNSKNPQQSANDAQVEIANLLGTYNSSVSSASQEEGDSTTYFDGRLGAKPISTSEILAAVDEKIAQINVNIKGNQEQLQELETRALDTIGKEISKSQAEAPFEAINFGKETSDFTSSNINSVIGSVAVSQANAVPSHSVKLLS